MMNEWLYDLCAAIARQEGFFSKNPSVTPIINHNPGDIRFAHQTNATRPDGSTVGNLQVEPIAKFSSAQAGICGLYRDVLAKVATGMTLRELIYVWAPASDGNQPGSYLDNVASWTGIAKDQKLIDLFELEPKP